MRNDKENIIVDLTFKFALGVIEFSELLLENKNYIISKQILKSGTSIGALVREAQNAESKADFIHKMKIAAKEADETMYWLELCKFSKNYPNGNLLIEDLTSIIKVLSKIIGTSKR
ncbi:MAG: four helix bundle protein [Bacteroidetes bacterium]|nr:four helix bundle protein [Bacteroidota bacterium]